MDKSDDEFRKERGDRLQRAMVAKGWTRKVLAAQARCDEKTLRNVFSGATVRDQTIINLFQVLGLEPEMEPPLAKSEASEDLFGGYARTVNRAYEGIYLLYRRTFSESGGIYRSLISIEWSDFEKRFVFFENFKDSAALTGLRTHNGSVFISAHTNLVHLMTAVDGSVRLMTLTRLNILDGTMRGCILTQRENPMFFQPTISPVYMRKIDSNGVELKNNFVLARDSNEFLQIKNELSFIEKNIVQICF